VLPSGFLDLNKMLSNSKLTPQVANSWDWRVEHENGTGSAKVRQIGSAQIIPTENAKLRQTGRT
jgi:hypothetical protein